MSNTKVEKRLREIEGILDNHHKSLEILSEPRPRVLLHVLRVFEDMTRLRGFLDTKPIVLGQREVELHNFLDFLAMAVQWVFDECPNEDIDLPLDVDAGLYAASFELLTTAGDYCGVCDGFTMWSRGRHCVELDEEHKRIDFGLPAEANTAYEAADVVLDNRKKTESISSPMFAGLLFKMLPANNQLCGSIQQKDGQIEYEIAPDVWEAYKEFSAAATEITFELPEEWDFGSFTLGEYALFWQTLHARCMIHAYACLNSGVEGAGIESVVLIISPEELAADLSARCELPAAKIRTIVDYITFDPAITNNDVIFQPLIPVSDGRLAVSPSLVMASKAERNLACLVNKKDQPAYSRLSASKEDLILDEMATILAQSYPALEIVPRCKLPTPLPDIDLAIFDAASKCILMLEVKWLIPSDSIKEVCSRDEDIAKGIGQANDILAYYQSSSVDVQNRAFGREIGVESAHALVVTRHNIGSSHLDRSTPVVDESSFFRMLSVAKGNLVELNRLIVEEAFLPKEGIDWCSIRFEIDYAGYRLTGPGFIVDPTPAETAGKPKRNDPCPCGKVNTTTGKPMKYKKCCGKK